MIEGETSARDRVADFWDKALQDWIADKPLRDMDLIRWQASYQGKDDGQVTMQHFPDPYAGDIRGIRSEPRIILLGLNPGIGYDSLQGRDGIWTRRIAEQGYSYCFSRSPEEDPETWLKLHGKRSPYWRDRINFTKRWLNDPSTSIKDILNFELYPWHSKKLNGKMDPPQDLIHKYVFEPARETRANEVFAFGSKWFGIIEKLGLNRIALYGPHGDALPSNINMAHWRLGFYRLSDRQIVIVSAQKGYAGPPEKNRLELLRSLHEAVREGSAPIV